MDFDRHGDAHERYITLRSVQLIHTDIYVYEIAMDFEQSQIHFCSLEN